ncbi:MAG TPA: dienelactone hydrolase family protein [Terriglobales bacterium]|nr:dienelactone hydrolase family protein [Terriglobales bacterium]
MQVAEQKIEISAGDGKTEAYLYEPTGEGAWPAVIHYTDIGGIRAAPLAMAKRLAEQGYVVLVPNVFYRTSDLPVFKFPLKFGEDRTAQRIKELSSPLTPDAMARDASAYVDFLDTVPTVKSRAMGVVGHCYTGGMALRAAAARPDNIGAAASFHGGHLYTDAPTSPHILLPKIKARLYFGHAVKDRGMSADAIKNFEAALRFWGGEYESQTYEGAYHGWTVPDSPVYNRPQAERAFEKLTRLFSATLR